MKKKIILGLCYGLCGALLLAIIIMALIPVSTLNLKKATQSVSFRSSSSSTVYSLQKTDTKEFNQFYQNYDLCFKQNSLTAIFSGSFNINYVLNSTTESSRPDAPYVSINYAENQKLYNGDTAVKTLNNSSVDLEFKKAMFQVYADESNTTITIYLIDDENDALAYITVSACTKPLFDFVSNYGVL